MKKMLAKKKNLCFNIIEAIVGRKINTTRR